MPDNRGSAAERRASLLQLIHRLDRDLKHKIRNLEFQKSRRVQIQNAIKSCLECTICCNNFDCGEASPRVFGCGHVCCEKCVFQILEGKRRPTRILMGTPSNTFPGVIVRCPTCRKQLPFSENQTELSIWKFLPLLEVIKNFTNTAYLDDVDQHVQYEEVIVTGDETLARLRATIKNLEQKILDANQRKISENNLHAILEKLSQPIKNCAKCHNPFQEAPHSLKCGHTFCAACNNLFFERFGEIGPAVVTCPTCQKLSHYQTNEKREIPIYLFISSSQLH
ncbi:unnamed protein product [Caenorhabditis nigoni]